MTTDLKTTFSIPKDVTSKKRMFLLTKKFNSNDNGQSRMKRFLYGNIRSGAGSIKMAGLNSSIINCMNDSNMRNEHECNQMMCDTNNNMDTEDNVDEMRKAIDELRRQNERLLQELGATQDLLDLFERYRDLTEEHMSLCTCDGKNQLFDRWLQYEQDYKKLLPIKRLNPTSQVNTLHVKPDPDETSNEFAQQLKTKKIIPLRCETNQMNGNVKYTTKVAKTPSSSFSSFESWNHTPNPFYKKQMGDLTLKMVNGQNNDSDDEIHSQRLPKGFVRSYLDKIRPVNFSSNSTHENHNSSSTQQESSITDKNLIQRKRPLNLSTQPFIMKKFKCGDRQMVNIKNKIRSFNCQADHEVERLDKLNNALDQILMGRFEVFNQLDSCIVDDNNNSSHSNTNHDIDDDNIDDNDSIAIRPILEEENRPSSLQAKIILNGQDNSSDDDDDEDESEMQDEDEEDIVFLNDMEHQNNEQIETLATKSNNTILSAVLKSGLKGYTSTSSQRSASRISMRNQMFRNSIDITPQQISQQSSKVTVKNFKSDAEPNKHLPYSHKRPHLTSEERADIINRLKHNESGAKIAREYGITKQAVSAIKRRAQLMGDSGFSSKCYFSGTGAQATSGDHSPVSANNFTISSQTNRFSQKKDAITINLSSGSSALDNSLVSRQLKQQKVNATVIKQSNLLAKLPRKDTASLVLPVNPVAIIKSQMAAKQREQQMQNSSAPSADDKTVNTDGKRLILSRLLEGTECYQPTYASTSTTRKSPNIVNEEDVNTVNQDVDEGDDGDDEDEDEERVTPNADDKLQEIVEQNGRMGEESNEEEYPEYEDDEDDEQFIDESQQQEHHRQQFSCDENEFDGENMNDNKMVKDDDKDESIQNDDKDSNQSSDSAVVES